MKNVLTISTGTTNTVINLWRSQIGGIGQMPALITQTSVAVGVRDTATTGSPVRLQGAVSDAISLVLHQAELTIEQIDLVLGSGMLTSNLGLYDVPHLPAPCGLQELAAGMVEVSVPQVCEKPLWLIPGVCNAVTNIGLHNCEAMDMMRGEEVETMALITRLQRTEPAIYALPGSHSKFVHVDAKQRITGCVTTMAGEMLRALTQNTILADSLNSDLAHKVDAEMLRAGARAAANIGLSRACFTVRILDQFTVYERNARANFLLGAVLGADLLMLKNSSAINLSPASSFVIAGKPVMRDALALLIAQDDFFSGPLYKTSDAEQENLAGLGAMAVAQTRQLL